MPELLTRIGIWLSQSEFVRWLFRTFGSPRLLWNVWAATKQGAMFAVLHTTDEKEFNRWGEDNAEWIRSFLRPNSRVLDVGCGIGLVEVYLASHCAELHGVDISGRMIRFARQRTRHLPNVRFHRANAVDLSLYPNESFDFIFSIIVLQHMEREDALSALLEIFRLLKSGGRGVLQFPNLLEPKHLQTYLEFGRRRRVQHPNRIRYYTRAEVEAILGGIGFVIEDWVRKELPCDLHPLVRKPEVPGT